MAERIRIDPVFPGKITYNVSLQGKDGIWEFVGVRKKSQFLYRTKEASKAACFPSLSQAIYAAEVMRRLR